MELVMRLALSFDDISLLPAHSELDSRDEVDISSDLGFAKLSIPILAAPMDTVCGIDMMDAMKDAGGLGVHHRYCDYGTLRQAAAIGPIAVSPSMGLSVIKEILSEVNPQAVLMLDIAHGDSKPALDFAEQCVRLGGVVISGNIVTWRAAYRYWNIGVSIFRVGLGAGSACSTRVNCGVGIPQLTAIQDVYDLIDTIKASGLHVLSDGGIRNSGDVVKALAAGASACICGHLLAGASEARGSKQSIDGYKRFRGMASERALQESGRGENAIEGVSGVIKLTGPVKDTLDALDKGIRAGFAYVGARNIAELRENAEFVQVTQAGWQEGLPRI